MARVPKTTTEELMRYTEPPATKQLAPTTMGRMSALPYAAPLDLLSHTAESVMMPRLARTMKSVISTRKFSLLTARRNIETRVNNHDRLATERGMYPSSPSAARWRVAARNAGTNVVTVAMRNAMAMSNSWLGP